MADRTNPLTRTDPPHAPGIPVLLSQIWRTSSRVRHPTPEGAPSPPPGLPLVKDTLTSPARALAFSPPCVELVLLMTRSADEELAALPARLPALPARPPALAAPPALLVPH